MPGISDYIVTDDLTILLALIAATTFLLNNLYKPQPLVHPILLGRQSDVGRARNPGESAVYRNYGTGLMGRVRAHVIHIQLGLLLVIVSCASEQGGCDPGRPHQTRIRGIPYTLGYKGEDFISGCVSY